MDLGALRGAENSDKIIVQTPPECPAPAARARVWLVAVTGGGRPAPLWVEPGEGAERLKGRIARELRLPGPASFHLLLNDRRLESGSVTEAGVRNGSVLTLVPVLQTGLKASRPKAENSILQALESLTDTQVSDFLTGRSPLTLTLTIGGAVSYVQLQLTARRSVTGAHRQTQPPTEASRSQPREESSFTGPRIECLQQLGPGCFSGIFSGSLPPTASELDGGRRRRREDLALVQKILRDVMSASRSAAPRSGAPRSSAATPAPPRPGRDEETRGVAEGCPARQPHHSALLSRSPARPASRPASCPAPRPAPPSREVEGEVTRRKLKSLQLLIRQRRERREGRGPYTLRPPSHGPAQVASNRL